MPSSSAAPAPDASWGGRRVHGITDEHHAALVPGLGNHERLKRTIDYLALESEGVADFGNETTEALQHFTKAADLPFRTEMVIAALRRQRKHVKLILRHRRNAGLDRIAQIDFDHVQVWGPRRQRPESSLSGELGSGRVRELHRTDLGMDTIGADHKIVGSRGTIAEFHRYFIGLNFDARNGDTQINARSTRPCPPGQDSMQCRSENPAAIGQTRFECGCQDLSQQGAICKARARSSTWITQRCHLIGDAQLAQGAKCWSLDGDSGAIGFPVGIQINQVHIVTMSCQLDGARHPGDTTAHN